MTSFHFLVEPAEPPLSKHRSASLPDGCPRPFRSRTRPATMSRNAALVLFIAFGTVFQLSCGTQVNVTKDNKLCLFANLTLHFSVSYEVIGNKTETAAFELPENVTSDGSSCDTAESTLKLNFGDGHSLSASFIASEGSYEVESLTFSYNLNDSTLFNNSASEDTMTTKVDLQATKVALNTCYSCHSEQMIRTDLVNMTMWNVLVQAFISDGVKSENITSCAADTPVTPAPTSAPTPSTNTTTVPVTNATSTAPPTTASPPLPDPKTGNYSVTPVNQTDACLLANFGLRLGFKQGDKYEVMNFDPTGANVSGLCGVNSSELTLESNSVTLTMTFTTDTKKFRLHTLNVIVKTSSGAAFSGGNATLSLWEAAVGSSYMCNKEQNVTISEELTLLTVDVRVQPFGVKKGLFSTAHECSVDDASILVPIIVGAALAGLILIVVIAYVIGRRKTYVGYQTL